MVLNGSAVNTVKGTCIGFDPAIVGGIMGKAASGRAIGIGITSFGARPGLGIVGLRRVMLGLRRGAMPRLLSGVLNVPILVRRRRDELERHLDAIAVLGRLADFMHDFREQLGCRGAIDVQRE